MRQPAQAGRRGGLAIWSNEHMLDHVAIQCSDLEASVTFYTAVLSRLGGHLMVDNGDALGFGTNQPTFWLGPHRTGAGFRESHIAFRAADRNAVNAFFEAAKSTGAEVLYEPDEWPQYHPGYYAAFVRDPDGNNVEAVYHGS
jgi:catechol 2,3-dioxygenase-like lactoylglutathione lyase family enzyme